MVATAFTDLDEDQRVVMRDMAWPDYEAMLAIRGDRAGVRMYYLDGEIEIVSPTKTHEGRKTWLARLLEHWAFEVKVPLEGFGSWTLKQEVREAGAEPDECYLLGDPERDVPDLVIEIEWSRELGLPKLEIYRRLGVRELWTFKRDGSFVVQVRSTEGWVESQHSQLLPALDLAWLVSFLDSDSQTAAVQRLHDALASRQG